MAPLVVVTPAHAEGPTITGSDHQGVNTGYTVLVSPIQDTAVTIYGTDLTTCTSLWQVSAGFAGGPIAVTPSVDGKSATFNFTVWNLQDPDWLGGWAILNCGYFDTFLTYGELAFPSRLAAKPPLASATSLSTGGEFTLEFPADAYHDPFYGVTSIKFDSIAVTSFTVLSSSKLKFTIPSGVTNSTNCIEIVNFAGKSSWCPDRSDISLAPQVVTSSATGGAASATPNGDGTWSLLATPDSGYTFAAWDCGEETPASATSAATTVNPTADTTCTATFSAVAPPSGGGGRSRVTSTISFTGSTILAAGDPLTLGVSSTPAGCGGPTSYVLTPSPLTGEGSLALTGSTAETQWWRPGIYQVGVTAGAYANCSAATDKTAILTVVAAGTKVLPNTGAANGLGFEALAAAGSLFLIGLGMVVRRRRCDSLS